MYFCLVETEIIRDYLGPVSLNLNFDGAILENMDWRILMDFSLRTEEALILERYF